MKTLSYDENGERIIEGESEDVTNLQENIDAQLSEMFEQFGGDENDAQFKINIYRVQEGRGELGYCFSCVPSELPILDKIRDDYGSGKYEIRVYEKTDKTRLKKRTKLVIEKANKKQPAPTPQNNSGELSAILSAMAEQNRVQMENFQRIMMIQRPAQTSAPAADPMQMMTSMVAAMAQLNGMLPKAETSNGMEQFIKGIEIAKELNVESNGAEKGLADVLITAAKEFGQPLLEMSKMAVRQAPAQAPAQAQAVPAPSVQPHPPQPAREEDPMFYVKMQLNMLVSKAAANADPALYADLILDSMPESQIREFLGRPDLREFLTGLNPDVDHYWPWFAQLQNEVMAGIDAESVPENLTNTETVEDTITDNPQVCESDENAVRNSAIEPDGEIPKTTG